ncbi:alpha/beta fold hydrolase [Burkholderia sp. PAMC 26561]|uniref:alpha/beta fold hydrolase n=1 Tax=Burkholderia sp. PAMC 26561 TaxID=1795043 RepID=UPI00076B458E|nr:alpha/beta hydrolase [Burkholderia sp. PAMC 26561]AME27128.1 oxidoreductase [Burkholderia sp. PAMC 26561]AME27723.1 oxidoreductase [Burkholderia sp. PAMC 26561]
MPAVLIHGVPDTFRVWGSVRACLSRKDVFALSLPGFGSPLPRNFSATKEEYISWIVGQLERFVEPVDLVGHDWGCMFAMRIASLRPDLIRSWAAGGGPLSIGYEWHPLAKIWQTPEEGEEWMRAQCVSVLPDILAKSGLSRDNAKATVSHIDHTMQSCILNLYRSARRVGEEWQPGLANVTAPGLVFWGESDSACPVRFSDELVANTGARRMLKVDSEHWTILERSEEVAHALEDHWAAAASTAIDNGEK